MERVNREKWFLIGMSIPFIACVLFYQFYQNVFEAAVAVNQVDDNKMGYAISCFLAAGSVQKILFIVWLIAVMIVLITSKKGETK
jgi:phosphoglycerol transferase MdoB-like AlkP superfamily enzyme